MTCFRRSALFLAVVFPHADDPPPHCRTGVHVPIFPLSFRPPSPRSKAKARSKFSQNLQEGVMYSRCRVIVLVLTVLAIVCVVFSNIFPVLIRKSDSLKTEYTLWYAQSTLPNGSSIRRAVAGSSCGQYRTYFQLAEAASVLSICIGVFIAVFCFFQFLCVKARFFFWVIWCLMFLAFLLCGACVTVIVYGYLNGFCQGGGSVSVKFAPFKGQGYDFGVSFYFICIACGLFLLSSFFECLA
ncbi:hypothetical protein MOQ_002663 [Trypanosoma cruzi marinkellei]|uniref:Amastin n=1 Tax=Trypanosoma cruzi marinkellei TaxID=85056 RepID=K2N666_TRYCR|nr:hypothetical protein MOQ_002663 [Trypanosoma cruzi marinkellei]